ncbi:MAG: branched-chain amino acid transport system substrate-binding protein [Verrucomicrobiota bacterium]|nr:branched-chain amino acid transport system substrate-binding protein [Verrucomicrobiota bacterium]
MLKKLFSFSVLTTDNWHWQLRPNWHWQLFPHWQLLLAVTLSLSTYSSLGATTVKIGEVDPLTGGVSQFGIGCHQGFVLAFEEINGEGGILGQKIELVTEDDQSKPGQSATAVRKLITQDKVVAILGDATSSATLEAAPIAQSDKIPMITPTATNPRITEVGDFIFRVCFLDEFQGRVLAKFAREKLKAQRIFTLTDVKQDYSVDLLKFFKDEFTKLGGTIVGEQSYSTGDIDFRAQLTPIRGTKPDAVYVPGYYQEVALIVKQGRQIGLTMPFIGCDGWANQALVTIGGKAIDGCFFTDHFSPDDQSPIVKSFVAKYQEKYGALPDTFSALGYDAARLLADALKRAGSTDSPALREALAKTQAFPGVTGQISIDANRNASKPGLIVTVKDGKFVIAEKIAP